MPHLSLIAVASTLVLAVPAGAAVLTVGGGYAQSCYEATEAQEKTWAAMQSCNRALTEEALTSEDRVATLVNRGILHLRRASLGQANADFDAALAMNPRQAEAWLNKAVLNARYGRSVDALPMVEKALELKTTRPALAYFVRAMAHEDSGNVTAAYLDLQRARALEPKWSEPAIELKRFKVRQL
jgi:tetratricopeptide (TPR) repeat protein